MKKIYSFLFLVWCNFMAFAQIQITSEPYSQNVCSGQSVTFYVTAIGDNLQYQWYYQGDPINGGTTNEYNISNTTTFDAGSYFCVVSNGSDPSVQSIPAVLVVNESTVIISQSNSVNACYGDAITLTVIANGTALSYQWYKGNSPVGGNANTFTISFADFSSNGNYRVDVMNSCQTVSSQVIAVTVNTPPGINTVNVQPEACAGDTVNLGVSASGTNLSYEWYHNDVLVASQNSFSIAGCSAADSGIYQIVVKNGCSQIFSYVNLNVNTPVAPTGAAAQSYTQGETLLNLDISGAGIKWYATAADASNHENVLPMATLLQDGITYFATQTLGGMCESGTSLAVTASLSLAIENMESTALDYFPNPVAADFNFSSNQKIKAINIVNMLGQRVVFENVNAMLGKIDMASLPNGNYIAEFSFENGVKRVQLLKQ